MKICYLFFLFDYEIYILLFNLCIEVFVMIILVKNNIKILNKWLNIDKKFKYDLYGE